MKRKDFIYRCATASLGLALPGLAAGCGAAKPALSTLIGRRGSVLGAWEGGADSGFGFAGLPDGYAPDFPARTGTMYAENDTMAGYTLRLGPSEAEQVTQRLVNIHGPPAERHTNDMGRICRWSGDRLCRSLHVPDPERLGPGFPALYSCYAAASTLIVF